MILQCIMAWLGSIGFALWLRMRGRQVLYAGLGGLITCIIYLGTMTVLQQEFLCNFLAGLFAALYAEVMARVNKAPATVFLTSTAIPLIPGSKLYYMMYGLVNRDERMFAENGNACLTIALAISLGFVVVSVINHHVNLRRR